MMKTEITKDRLDEYFYPTENFHRPTDGQCVDYAEIEINPAGIRKLEENIDRYGNPGMWTERDWEEMNNPGSDTYEHVVAYVHFDAGTDTFNELFIEVVTSYGSDALEPRKLVDEKEKQNIIDAALESLHKYRGTGKCI